MILVYNKSLYESVNDFIFNLPYTNINHAELVDHVSKAEYVVCWKKY